MLQDSGRPNAEEYAPFFAGYVERVPDGSIIDVLEAQLQSTQLLFAPLSPEQVQQRPTPADWNMLEVLGHITDAEQIFMYRALHIARGDTTPLPGFEQDDYVRVARFANCSMDDLLRAYTVQRQATLVLLQSFDFEAWHRRGIVSNHPASARAWAYIATGHERHHIEDFHKRYGV